VYIPFVLVSSATQSDLSESQHIDAPVKTEFSSTSWPNLKSAYFKLYHTDPTWITSEDFLILDQQSASDRKVIIIQQGAEWLMPDGSEAPATEGPDVTKWTVWKKYRVPFDQVQFVLAGIEGACNMDLALEYFESEVEREECAEEEEEEEEETDSDETTSEDLEYGDFPIKAK
jgi:hypothetical protein